jgi:hypothetical protein
MIVISARMDKRSLRRIEKKVVRAIAANPATKKRLGELIVESPSMTKWKALFESEQFQIDFGMYSGDVKSMSEDFFDEVKNVRVVVSQPGQIILQAFDEKAMRAITTNIWRHGDHSDIIVNAWDIYEYGVVGDKNSGGVIDNYHVERAITPGERAASRSNKALMKKGGNFSFNNGKAPGINFARSSIRVNTLPQLIETISFIGRSIA